MLLIDGSITYVKILHDFKVLDQIYNKFELYKQDTAVRH